MQEQDVCYIQRQEFNKAHNYIRESLNALTIIAMYNQYMQRIASSRGTAEKESEKPDSEGVTHAKVSSTKAIASVSRAGAPS